VARLRRGAAVAACLGLGLIGLSGCGGGKAKYTAPHAPRPASGAAPWPAPSNPLERTRLAGLTPETHEFFFYHVHAHLDVYVNGQLVRVPAAIGINIRDPAVHHAREPDGTLGYGGISPPCKHPCISPLHTHDDFGILHTESKRTRPNRLGQFFVEWGVRLHRSCVGGYCKPRDAIAVFVDGKRYTGDPAQIPLTDGKEIAIVIGSPPSSIPSQFP
jgi:hypothetical protein